jgi:hypothetical protein
MATTNKSEQIFIGVNNEVIELTGADKETFLANRKASVDAKALLESEAQAKKQARIDAITKLGEASGLTTDEINAILNI